MPRACPYKHLCYMPFFTDQIGRTIELPSTPKKIVSLVPSQTELLADLGLNQEVVGITKFCVHPETWFRTKQRIGGTKTVEVETVKTLQPDLIIANKEENVREQVETLAKDFPVWVSDVNTVPQAVEMMQAVGEMTGKKAEAHHLVNEIEQRFDNLASVINSSTIRTAYLIWREPYMTVGGDTFIHDILISAGFQNSFANRQRYPAITIEELNECELLMLSSEPYPFKQKHIDELQAHLPNTKILLVDGELFSWYGSRLLHTPDYLTALRQQVIKAL